MPFPFTGKIGKVAVRVAETGITPYPTQEAALLELGSGKHVMLSTPTGSGKSLVAATPASASRLGV